MTRLLRCIWLLIFACLSGTCTQVTSIDGLDTESWKADKNGCNERRPGLEKSFLENQDKLKGYSQEEIGKILGKPDEVDLYRRNQKFFIYHIAPGNPCEGVNIEGRPRSLYIRFSALNLSNEVFIRDY